MVLEEGLQLQALWRIDPPLRIALDLPHGLVVLVAVAVVGS